MIILSGDIGGTNTRLQLFDFIDSASPIKTLAHTNYKNSEYPSFIEIIRHFLDSTHTESKKIAAVCFGIAGPIIEGEVKFTNLLWSISSSEIKKQFEIEHVALINDYEAIGYGIETLGMDDMYTLQKGKYRDNAVKAFIGAGTGLGVGFTVPYHNTYVVLPTEGGHVDFAPTDDDQIQLLNFLRKKFHRVSFERVLSGPGLVNIYRFVCSNKIFGEEESEELRFLIQNSKENEIASIISRYAVENKDILAMRALDIFIRAYGSMVGNLALTTLPYGGLYIVGGIAPKLLSQIKEGKFLEMYGDKGRMSDLIKGIPLHIVTNTDVGLQGTAVYAKKMVETSSQTKQRPAKKKYS